jgi:hypothetical protein
MVIQNGVSSPIAVVAAYSTGERQVEMGDAARAYTSADTTLTIDSPQRYIMQTDSGSLLLPAQWHSAGATGIAAYQSDLRVELLTMPRI